jgi:hypothetical protein
MDPLSHEEIFVIANTYGPSRSTGIALFGALISLVAPYTPLVVMCIDPSEFESMLRTSRYYYPIVIRYLGNNVHQFIDIDSSAAAEILEMCARWYGGTPRLKTVTVVLGD